jgi:hypothetical protein
MKKISIPNRINDPESGELIDLFKRKANGEKIKLFEQEKSYKRQKYILTFLILSIMGNIISNIYYIKGFIRWLLQSK